MNGYGLCGRLEGNTNEKKNCGAGMWRVIIMVTSRIIAKSPGKEESDACKIY
jgi:hypothetical protein